MISYFSHVWREWGSTQLRHSQHNSLLTLSALWTGSDDDSRDEEQRTASSVSHSPRRFQQTHRHRHRPSCETLLRVPQQLPPLQEVQTLGCGDYTSRSASSSLDKSCYGYKKQHAHAPAHAHTSPRRRAPITSIVETYPPPGGQWDPWWSCDSNK